MSASPPFTCEVCGAGPLRYHGGPHPPRWCPEHRGERTLAQRAERARRNARLYRATAGDPGLKCGGCSTRLLEPSGHGYCRFCAIESGLMTEADLLLTLDQPQGKAVVEGESAA